MITNFYIFFFYKNTEKTNKYGNIKHGIRHSMSTKNEKLMDKNKKCGNTKKNKIN